jgi:hypothetical protein
VGKNQQGPRAGLARVRGGHNGGLLAVGVVSLHRGGQRRSRVRDREAQRPVPGPPLVPAAGARGDARGHEGARRGNVRRGGGVHPRRGHARAAVEARGVRAGQVVRPVREGGGRGGATAGSRSEGGGAHPAARRAEELRDGDGAPGGGHGQGGVGEREALVPRIVSDMGGRGSEDCSEASLLLVAVFFWAMECAQLARPMWLEKNYKTILKLLHITVHFGIWVPLK